MVSRVGTLALVSLTCVLAVSGRSGAVFTTCRDAIRQEAGKLAATRLLARKECEQRRLRGKLGPGGDCREDESVRAAVEQAESRLRFVIGKRCGGTDKTCGGGIGWDIGTCPDLEQLGCTNAIDDCGDVGDCVACATGAALDHLAGSLFDAFVLPTDDDRALNRCQRTIGREATRLLVARSKALGECWHAVDKGREGFAAPCPGGDETGEASRRLLDAERRLPAKVCRACGGDDRVCGGGDDLSPSAIGFRSTCPSVTVPGGFGCGGPVAMLVDLVDCVLCVSRFNGDCLDALAVPWGMPYPSECNASSPASCGDGLVNGPSEECDPPADGSCPGLCQIDCTCGSAPACGDGVVDLGEECDETGCVAREVCQADCTCVRVPACGDAIVDPGEECDGIGCPVGEICQPDCTCVVAPGCGNGIVELGEKCDQTGCMVDQVCRSDCTCAPAPVCGDGTVDPGEECDATGCPGGEVCQPDCTCVRVPVCGDGVVDPGEECDQTECSAGEVCQPDCTCAIVAACGNGAVDPGEECDGTQCPGGEECLADCTCQATPPCGNGIVDPGEACDGTECPAGEICQPDCTCILVPGCGNGVIDPGEECDGLGCPDGEECLADCICSTTPLCGNGVVEPGEQCDASFCPVGECSEECTCV